MKNVVCALVLLISVTSLAQNNLFIVKDGSVARCNSVEDSGSRAFSLKAKTVESSDVVELELKTFKCIEVEGRLTLVATALEEPHKVKLGSDHYATRFVKPVVAITNIDRTQEYARINLDGSLQTQKILVSQNLLLGLGKVDLTILSLAITEKNGQIFDQGMTFGGHYRLSQQP